jgi:hypothetical protein
VALNSGSLLLLIFFLMLHVLKSTGLYHSLKRSRYSISLFMSLCFPFNFPSIQLCANHIWQVPTTKPFLHSSTTVMSASTMSVRRLPVYFLGIGGPNFIENTAHPAYTALAEVGREITTKVEPKAVVVFSAHWAGDPNKIKINVAEDAGLIYDFYGFPPHYYEYEYPYKGNKEVAAKVIEKLATTGVEVESVERGLDHGVWVGFLAGKYSINLKVIVQRSCSRRQRSSRRRTR